MIEYEKGLEYPPQMKQVVELEDEGGRRIVYTAWIVDIKFKNMDDVTGTAIIKKHSVTSQPSRRKFNWRKFRFETVTVPPRWDLLWNFSASHGYIISNGNIINPEKQFGYRSALAGAAATGGVLITANLFAGAFGPIERELLRLQRMVRRHGLEVIAA